MKLLPIAAAAACISTSSALATESGVYDYETQTSAHAQARTARAATLDEPTFSGEASPDPIDLSRTIGIEVRPGPRQRSPMREEGWLDGEASPGPRADPSPAPR